MYLEYLFTCRNIGSANIYRSVKTSGSCKCRVENVGSVCCGNYYESRINRKSVHFNEKLVERLFTFVVTTAKSRASLSADSVDFIDEYNAGEKLFCLLEQITYTRSSDTYEHFNEIGTAYGKERNSCFARNSLCNVGFTCSRRTYKKNALWDSCAQGLKFGAILKKFDYFNKLLFFLFGTRDISKCYFFV